MLLLLCHKGDSRAPIRVLDPESLVILAPMVECGCEGGKQCDETRTEGCWAHNLAEVMSEPTLQIMCTCWQSAEYKAIMCHYVLGLLAIAKTNEAKVINKMCYCHHMFSFFPHKALQKSTRLAYGPL